MGFGVLTIVDPSTASFTDKVFNVTTTASVSVTIPTLEINLTGTSNALIVNPPNTNETAAVTNFFLTMKRFTMILNASGRIVASDGVSAETIVQRLWHMYERDGKVKVTWRAVGLCNSSACGHISKLTITDDPRDESPLIGTTASDQRVNAYRINMSIELVPT